MTATPPDPFAMPMVRDLISVVEDMHSRGDCFCLSTLLDPRCRAAARAQGELAATDGHLSKNTT